MHRLKLLTIVIMLVSWGELIAQTRNASINFVSERHDFGRFNEADGKREHRFVFTNTGSVPLVISNVRSSCGCTAPSWTKEPVMPGAKGYVAAVFDPAGRPGPFDKTVTVLSNAEQSQVTLRVVGEVVGKSPSIEDEYRFTIGNLRLKSNNLNFDKLTPSESATRSIEFINKGTSPVKVGANRVPAHLTVRSVPEVVRPGAKASLEVIFNAAKKNDWGFIVDRVELTLDGKAEASSRISISATIEEDFSKLTSDQMAKAPRAEFKTSVFDFGRIRKSAKVEFEYLLTNKGQSDLVIRKINASCGCTAVNPGKNLLRPGESTSIKTVFNATNQSGRQNKTITVITNDPSNPRAILWVKGEVE